MSATELRLNALGLTLPQPMKAPPGVVLIGAHARSAVGMAELPFDIPVEVEAEVEILIGETR